uniref:Uncharacterized protein n=1 Tax=Anguilla anguilla TaxID=7936 RepID=A0A0E9PZ92_ANGAN
MLVFVCGQSIYTLHVKVYMCICIYEKQGIYDV